MRIFLYQDTGNLIRSFIGMIPLMYFSIIKLGFSQLLFSDVSQLLVHLAEQKQDISLNLAMWL